MATPIIFSPEQNFKLLFQISGFSGIFISLIPENQSFRHKIQGLHLFTKKMH